MNTHPIAVLIPDAHDLLALEAEELAGILLLHLNGGQGNAEGSLHHYNFFNELNNFPIYQKSDVHVSKKVNRALMEAWDWLLYEGFLAKQGDDSNRAQTFVTRRGQRIKSRDQFAAFQKARLLPKGQLHPLIANQVYPAFLRGDYETAIFQAFREVEIAIRTAGSFDATDVGDKLMRTAFGTNGPLTDKAIPKAEQEAMAHLFAGAFGLYRNSTAHRYVPTKAEEAAEVIMFASQLLRIVDRLNPKSTGGTNP